MDGVFSDATLTLFTVSYGTLFIVGFLANSVTCVTMLTRRLRNPIDVYTFNLSLCDVIILCIYTPTQIIFIRENFAWTMGEDVCKLVNSTLPVALMCTIATLVAMNLHYVMELLRHPDFIASNDERKHSFMTRVLSSRLVQEQWKVPPGVVLLGSWVSSVSISMPLIIKSRLDLYEKRVVICSEGWEDERNGEMYWVALFALTYCTPVVVLVMSYYALFQSMNKIQKRKEFSRYKKTLNVGMVLTGTFTVCNLLQHVFFFVTSTFSSTRIPKDMLPLLYTLANMSVILQAVLNPFIYGKFRKLLQRKVTRRKSKANEKNIRSKKRRSLMANEEGWN